MTRKRPVVAIDGPAGAGKSTVTKRVAKSLGYMIVDTGAIYRTVALAAQRAGLDFDDVEGVGALAEGLAAREGVRLVGDAEGTRALLDGEDVSGSIRTPLVSQGASKVSAQPRVRAALLELQRAGGRDGGGINFARVEERARRRFEELKASGVNVEYHGVRAEVVERDQRDSTRPIAPLRQAADALVLDSSELSIDQVVARIVAHVRAIEAELARS